MKNTVVVVVAMVVAVVVVLLSGRVVCYNEENTILASKLLDKFEEELIVLMRNVTEITWEHLTLIGVTEEDMRDAALRVMALRGEYQDGVKYYLQRQQRVRPDIRRRLKLAASGSLQREDALDLQDALGNMSRYYDTGRVCGNMEIEICKTVPGGIIRKFAEEMDPDKLEEMWKSWYSDVAKGLAPNFKDSVSALNEASRSVGWKDFSEEMMKSYEGYLSKADLVHLYTEVEDLYKLLHSYVRRKLDLRYPDEVILLDRPMPVTLLGDLFGRFWSTLYYDMKLYPNIKEPNITIYMQQVPGNWTWMYEWAEERYTSMGLKPLPKSFYEKSVLEDEFEGREMVCQPSAWDMYDQAEKDFRIYMCTEVTEEHLQTIIHLMGHLQYFQHYSHQPYFYRTGPNEGFQEAIANMFMLTFSSPTHLYAHGFGSVSIEEPLTYEIQMNYLFHVGLSLLPTLSYLLALDVWRWKVYEGIYSEDEWNCEYWKLRKYYSGVMPTTYRDVENLDMLPNHQLAHTQTASMHFTAVFMMFQILESLCKEAGHKGPMHTCDLYGSKKVGKILANAMNMGASQTWPFVYSTLTGESEISSGPLLRYFEPLTEWLRHDAVKAGLAGMVGWGETYFPLMGDDGNSLMVLCPWRHAAVLTLLYLAVTRLLAP